MEVDLPEEDFLEGSNTYLVKSADKDSAVYLEKILRSKEYDIDNIFNQFFLSVLELFKTPAFSLPDFIINLCRSLRGIFAPPILSKKFLLSIELLAEKFNTLFTLAAVKASVENSWQEIDPEALDLFCRIFTIALPPAEVYDYVIDLWQKAQWRKAICVASRFNLAQEFEANNSVLSTLIKRDEVELVHMLIYNNKELSRSAILKMCTNKHCKVAAKIVETSGLDPLDFPDLVERLNKNALRYFLSNDDLCLYQLIEITSDNPPMLGIIVEDLEFQGKKFKDCWQTGLASYILQQRPDLPVREPVRAYLSQQPPRISKGASRTFSPLQSEFDLLYPLPRESIIFISSPEELSSLNLSGHMAGIDCEWRPSIVKFQNTKVSIMQIALETHVYLLDLIALNAFPELDAKLKAFLESDIIKLGVSFEGDRKMLLKSYPHMEAFKNPLANYVDVVCAYTEIYGQSPGGLAGACELVLGRSLCKYEQRSNWENRPLRESQVHYAALDAYVQLLIMKEILSKSGGSIKSFVGIGKKGSGSVPGCDCCGSKLHKSKDCRRGKRCKICYMTGHKPLDCSN